MLNRNAIISLVLASGVGLCMSAQAASTVSDSLIRSSTTAQVVPAKASININTADASTLEAIKGLGAAKAQSIVDYRTKHGNFHSVQDLENVPGIGPKLLAKIQSQLAVK